VPRIADPLSENLPGVDLTSDAPALDPVTRLACRLFGVPLAALSFRSPGGSTLGWVGNSAFENRDFDALLTVLHPPEAIPTGPEDDRLAGLHLHSGFAPGFVAAAPLISSRGGDIGLFWIMDSRPRLTGFDLAALEDIARLTVAQIELRSDLRRNRRIAAQERLCRALVETIRDAVMILDPDGALHFASPAVANVLGYRPEELQGRNFLDLVLAPDVHRLRETLRRPADGYAPPERLLVRRKEGTIRTLEAVGHPLLDGGVVSAVVLTCRDISERPRTLENT